MVTHIDSERREFRTYSADFASERHAENMTAKGPSLKIGCDHALVAKFKELIIDRKYSIAAARQTERRCREFTMTINETSNVKYLD